MAVSAPAPVQSFPGLPNMIESPASFYPGSSFPQAYSGMHDSMPTSAASLIAGATDQTGGEGHSEPKVTRNTTIVPFVGKYSWMSELLPGQLLFSVVSDQFGIDELALLNLFNLNTMLHKGYDAAFDIVNNSALFTDKERRILTTTPTWKWPSLPFLKQKLNGAGDGYDVSNLRYLCPELFCERFSIAGWIEATQPDFSATQQRALCWYGVADNVENSFASDVQQGERIYLILMRTYDRTLDAYGPYAYHPWAGYAHPPDSVVTYMDITGHARKGQVIYVGRVNQWVDNEPHHDEVISSSIGLTGASKDVLPVSQHRSLRIAFSGSPRTGATWGMY